MSVRLSRQTGAWYDRLAIMQEGYYYPWRSSVPPAHGEDAYLWLVREHLSADADVLDVACGHGEIALTVAPDCRSVLGYDRTAAWINLARRGAEQRGLTNVRFLCHDSSPTANGGQTRLPAADSSFSLLICSKGPFHWLEDATRVARPGASLLMLVPDATPLTAWHATLPPALQWAPANDPEWARPAIEKQLAAAGLQLHSWWSFDVPEIFVSPEQLHVWLTFGASPDEVPPYEEVDEILRAIFVAYAIGDGIEIRRRRYLWKAVVHG